VITSEPGYADGRSRLLAHSNSAAPETRKGQRGLQKIPGSSLRQFPQLIKLFRHACFKVHKVKKKKEITNTKA